MQFMLSQPRTPEGVDVTAIARYVKVDARAIRYLVSLALIQIHITKLRRTVLPLTSFAMLVMFSVLSTRCITPHPSKILVFNCIPPL